MAKKISKKKAASPARKTTNTRGKPAARIVAGKKPAARASGATARRADLGAGVHSYFAQQTGAHKTIAERLHALVTTHAPKATHAVKWGMPVYEQNGMLCYIRVRPTYVTLGFYESGIELDDPRGLLDGSGENMRHAKLSLDAPLPEEDLVRFIRQAVAFNSGS